MNTANRVFILCFALLGGTYVVLIVAMLAADLLFTSPGDFVEALGSPEIRYAIRERLALVDIPEEAGVIEARLQHSFVAALD